MDMFGNIKYKKKEALSTNQFIMTDLPTPIIYVMMKKAG
jgi:hypothetical protein